MFSEANYVAQYIAELGDIYSMLSVVNISLSLRKLMQLLNIRVQNGTTKQTEIFVLQYENQIDNAFKNQFVQPLAKPNYPQLPMFQ